MRKTWILALPLAILATACTKVSFENLDTPVNTKLDGPFIDDRPPVPEPLPEPVRKAGACDDGQSVTACLKCEVPPAPPPPPRVSTKAQKLAKIMSMACQIYNKSYPSNYVAPTAAQIEAHVLACTPDLYPETEMTASQTSTIARLLDESNDSLRQKMFKGLWYQPPYSTDFELYFGLDGSEAAYNFCLDSKHLSPVLLTAEYAEVMSDTTRLEQWQRDPQAQARWNAAQTQRQQLLSCLNKPGVAVIDPPVTTQPVKTCRYRSFEGLYEMGGLQEIVNALAEGYKLSAENEHACMAITSNEGLMNYSGYIKIAGYKCE